MTRLKWQTARESDGGERHTTVARRVGWPCLYERYEEVQTADLNDSGRCESYYLLGTPLEVAIADCSRRNPWAGYYGGPGRACNEQGWSYTVGPFRVLVTGWRLDT